MTYTVEFTPQGFEDLSSLDPTVVRRIMAKLEWLSTRADSLEPESLQGRFKGLYKLRIGDWRLLYTTDPKRTLITVHVIAHRSKVYKT